jgi:hypothetical protein
MCLAHGRQFIQDNASIAQSSADFCDAVGEPPQSNGTQALGPFPGEEERAARRRVFHVQVPQLARKMLEREVDAQRCDVVFDE